MNLKKIAFSKTLDKEQLVVAFILVFLLFLFFTLSMFSETDSKIMIFSVFMAAVFLLVDSMLLVAFLIDFFNLNKELKEEVKLLKKHGYDNEQIDIIIKNREDFWLLFEELKVKEEKSKIQENDERIKNLYKMARINI